MGVFQFCSWEKNTRLIAIYFILFYCKWKFWLFLTPLTNQSVPTLQRDKQRVAKGSLILCPSNEGQSKFCFWLFMLEGVWFHICLCMVHGRRVCGKRKGGQLRMCLDIVSEYNSKELSQTCKRHMQVL